MRVAVQWVVKDDLNDKKLNMHEKTKKAKPGLQIMDELEDLAAEARAKGGAQNLDEEDINVRLKWMGLFHRAKQAPGTFMQRFKCPNGSFNLKQWKVRAAQGAATVARPPPHLSDARRSAQTEFGSSPAPRSCVRACAQTINDQVREYDDGSRDHWKPNGCYSLTTRQNVQLFGLRLEVRSCSNVPSALARCAGHRRAAMTW